MFALACEHMFGKIILIAALALIAWAALTRASHGAGPGKRRMDPTALAVPARAPLVQRALLQGA